MTAATTVAAGHISDHTRNSVMADLRQHFRPEFLNHVDDVVLFKPLTLTEIEQIVDLLTADIRKRLAEQEVKLELTEPARRHIAEAGYDPVYGARPLKRYLQHTLETKIGRALLAGDAGPGSTVTVDARDDDLKINVSPPSDAMPREPAGMST